MRTRTLGTITAVALGLAAGAVAAAPAPSAGDRALRTVSGNVLALEVLPGPDGEHWLEATVAGTAAAAETLRLRLGPGDMFGDSGFDLRPGDPVQLRFFVGEPPMDVQQVRNARTGRVLRLRGLHGDPLWTSFGAGPRGPASASPAPGPRPDRRGGRR